MPLSLIWISLKGSEGRNTAVSSKAGENTERTHRIFGLPSRIRKIINTNNIIEKLARKVRKYSKNKPSYPTDEAVLKSVFLAFMEGTRKLIMPVRGLDVILNQFITMFENR